jgi:hypothetical protein
VLRTLSILWLLVPVWSFAQDSAFERPGFEIGLIGGWQSFTPTPVNNISLESPLLGGELSYRFSNGLGLGVTVTYAQACFDNAGGVSPCVTQIPVVLELSWAKSLRGARPWLGLGAGLGFIGWTNSAIDVEDQGYSGTGLDIVYFRLRVGIDLTLQAGSTGIAMGPFFSVSLATAPQAVPSGLGSYSAHQSYVVGFHLMLLPGPR